MSDTAASSLPEEEDVLQEPQEAPQPATDETPAEDPQAQLEAEVARLKDQLLRTLAEMDNLRKRHQREKDEASKFAVTSFAQALLPIADTLRRALENRPQTPETFENFIAGLEMTERELLTVFERQGIQKLHPAGEKFDPNHHQAMMEVDRADQESGTVVTVLQPGYTLNDRLLRPALVSVAK